MTSVIEQRNQNNMEAVKYAECRKSHIHYLGWADGCQEYKESTSSPSKCEICGCHRNFHRKLEVAAAAEELLVRHEKEVGLQCGATAGQGKLEEELQCDFDPEAVAELFCIALRRFGRMVRRNGVGTVVTAVPERERSPSFRNP
ncbi:hypothetical protein MIMGU_mgv11b016840mg [Erythranthe guttata]|uniref:ZF-HD dimerization-type domain-containing protein n=1 Tax=Erythranthe guttata TaxID=4155 RepID=A0A022QCE2_ERYGU|nr:hypothetical protein MIMGU_mgv11b016840mg [Erythranthe guttata]